MNDNKQEKKVIITMKVADEIKRKLETICFEERITATYFFVNMINNYYKDLMKKKEGK